MLSKKDQLLVYTKCYTYTPWLVSLQTIVYGTALLVSSSMGLIQTARFKLQLHTEAAIIKFT